MTPAQAWESWASKHVLQLVIYAALVTFWAATTAASVAQKANRDDVIALREDVNTLLYFACQDPRYVADSRCTRRPQ